ncbi:glutamyl-tRNA reductase [Halobacteriales archaeon QS_1_68_20]|nr:MAG: glutamyl-tRNA reductase [Halobacteriales archaeon QS_1_68_20]
MSVVSGVSVAHGRAHVKEIEEASVADPTTRLEELRLREEVRGAYVLQTCNRAEVYVVTPAPAAGRAVLSETLPDLRDDAVRYMDHEESLRHLLRVAAGLESLVLGEDQILGQVRDAYERARGVGTMGSTLDNAVTKAIHVGERARTETTINDGVVSFGSAAVELADRERGVDGATALVVGAGEMGTLAARAFADGGAGELVVANRTVSSAEHVASEVDCPGRGVGLDDLPAAVADADLVVTATGSDGRVIDAETVADAGDTFVIDLAQPRDVAVEAAEREGVVLRDLESLESLTEQTREQRREAAREVEELVDAEFDHLQEQYKRERADDVIAAMYESAERVKERELEEAFRKLQARGDLTEEQRQAVESMADALVGQLLAAPTKSLRDAAAEDDWTTINTALQLFDPEFGAEMDGLPIDAEVPGSVPSTDDD